MDFALESNILALKLTVFTWEGWGSGEGEWGGGVGAEGELGCGTFIPIPLTSYACEDTQTLVITLVTKITNADIDDVYYVHY